MESILLGHGSGGKLMHELLDGFVLKELDNDILRKKMDSGIFSMGNKRIAFTTDSYVVNPVVFPGGDIGSLAVYGTVNDLSVCGAKPLYISLGVIIEEGLERRLLERIVRSIKEALKRSGVLVVTGDTKVVEKGSCDKIFINTAGIGEVYYEGLSTNSIRPGDSVIVNGPIGEHAISVLSKREGMEFETGISSDAAPLNGLIAKVLKASGKVRLMRDPTRGGIATTLNEMVMGMPFGIAVDESEVPVSKAVKSASELLGLDSLYLACEGRVIVVTAPEDEKKVLRAMKADGLGRSARCIGRVTREHKGRVWLNMASGGRRILDMLSGEQLPRIC
ncbi:MAG: hydrogenase expression/formation protein HypE [Candidatus Omnitrophota bacterium]